MKHLFEGIFQEQEASIEVAQFLLCVVVSLLIGMIIAGVYTYKSKYTVSFVVTLAMLPAIVCVVIMMVNGNVGAGVAVAGAFSLVRFRSVPGTAREIGTIFMAMGAGLITGMGYLAYGVLFTLLICLAMVIFTMLTEKMNQESALEKTLQITIPEDLNYENAFEDIFEKYASKAEILSVKTTNMGSMFRLKYDLRLKEQGTEKVFMDELRCRNGNLEISISKPEKNQYEL